jgi:hypothetical protein
MAHAIPISILTRPGIDPGRLTAEISWVGPNGSLAKVVETAPIQNGVAVYNGPQPEPGLQFAIRVFSSLRGLVFRSGPLLKLPGPPSPVSIINGAIFVYLSGFGFSLSQFNSEGQPEVLVQHLQNLPAPLRLAGVKLGADDFGHYSVGLRGSVQLPFMRLPFTYTRLFELVPSTEAGRPLPIVLAQAFGNASLVGAVAAPFRGVLDALMQNAVEQQLNTCLVNMANFDFSVNNVGPAGSISLVTVNAIRILHVVDQAQIEVGSLGGGAVSGPPVVANPG